MPAHPAPTSAIRPVIKKSSVSKAPPRSNATSATKNCKTSNPTSVIGRSQKQCVTHARQPADTCRLHHYGETRERERERVVCVLCCCVSVFFLRKVKTGRRQRQRVKVLWTFRTRFQLYHVNNRLLLSNLFVRQYLSSLDLLLITDLRSPSLFLCANRHSTPSPSFCVQTNNFPIRFLSPFFSPCASHINVFLVLVSLTLSPDRSVTLELRAVLSRKHSLVTQHVMDALLQEAQQRERARIEAGSTDASSLPQRVSPSRPSRNPLASSCSLVDCMQEMLRPVRLTGGV